MEKPELDFSLLVEKQLLELDLDHLYELDLEPQL